MSGVDIVTNVVPALLIVIGAPLGIWLWTRRSRGGTTHRLRITDRAALGRSLWVAVVEVDSKRFLVGAGEGSVGLISQLEDAPAEFLPGETMASPTDGTTDFPADPNTGNERPRMGLIERLQRMTLRTSQRTPSQGPFNAFRR